MLPGLGLVCCYFRADKIGRMFFFEKKNQKTFMFWARAGSNVRDSAQKFFASFFQKRSLFILVGHHGRP
jgi:hypothetical protein